MSCELSDRRGSCRRFTGCWEDGSVRDSELPVGPASEQQCKHQSVMVHFPRYNGRGGSSGSRTSAQRSS